MIKRRIKEAFKNKLYTFCMMMHTKTYVHGDEYKTLPDYFFSNCIYGFEFRECVYLFEDGRDQILELASGSRKYLRDGDRIKFRHIKYEGI